MALLVLALILLGVLAAFLSLRDGGGDDQKLAAFSTRGRSIEMAIPERLGPWGDVTGEAIQIVAPRR